MERLFRLSNERRSWVETRKERLKRRHYLTCHPFDAEQLDDDAPLHEIRDRALNQYIKSMGLENYKGSAGAAFGIGTTTAVADSVDTKLRHSNLIKGLGGVDTPSEKIMTDLQMKMSGGLSNKRYKKDDWNR